MWYFWLRIKTSRYTWALLILINLITFAAWASIGFYFMIVPHGILAIASLVNYNYYDALNKSKKIAERMDK